MFNIMKDIQSGALPRREILRFVLWLITQPSWILVAAILAFILVMMWPH